jgi:hypothetical protein
MWAKTRAVPCLRSKALNAVLMSVAKRFNTDVSEVRSVAMGGRVSARIWLAIQEEIARSVNAASTRRTIWIGTLAWASMLLA